MKVVVPGRERHAKASERIDDGPVLRERVTSVVPPRLEDVSEDAELVHFQTLEKRQQQLLIRVVGSHEVGIRQEGDAHGG